MAKTLKRIAVTGGAGQIAYSLLFRIASGEMLGKNQPIALHILEVPDALKILEGVQMEIIDCAFPLLKEIYIGSNPLEIFQGIHYAIFLGSKPRGPSMERSDLLQDNGKIFIQQGMALNEAADKDVKVLVVGNPCNTNCLIALSNAPRLRRTNFHAMTRLDQNRAVAQLAWKAKVSVNDVKNVTIWGNHSSTQVPDFFNAQINKHLVNEVITDRSWLEGPFISGVQKRGAEIIAARGKSSAASAANAVIDAVISLETPTAEGDWFSTAILSDGNPYGISENLVFSLPCRSNGNWNCEIVSGIPLNDFLFKRIKITENELKEERDLVLNMLKR